MDQLNEKVLCAAGEVREQCKENVGSSEITEIINRIEEQLNIKFDEGKPNIEVLNRKVKIKITKVKQN
jgi:hypothetical protein